VTPAGRRVERMRRYRDHRRSERATRHPAEYVRAEPARPAVRTVSFRPAVDKADLAYNRVNIIDLYHYGQRLLDAAVLDNRPPRCVTE